MKPEAKLAGKAKQELYHSLRDSYIKGITTLCGGSVAVTMTFLKAILFHPGVAGGFLIVIAWTFWVLGCIVAVLSSYYGTLSLQHEDNEELRSRVAFCFKAPVVLFALGMATLGVFVSLNLGNPALASKAG